jgi:uncharacterized repeat protein (TIGR01451 family)
LAWAVNAADNSSPALTRAPKAQTGQVFYFSRGSQSDGSASAGYADDRSADGTADSPADDSGADEAPPLPKRYKRDLATAPSAPTKNYKDLFDEPDAPRQSPAAAKAAQQTAARRAKQATSSAPTASRRVIEECAVNDTTDGDVAGEEVQLPGTDKHILAAATDEKSDVRHADHKVAEGATKRTVKQVQHTGRTSGKRGAPPAAANDDAAVAPSADDDADSAAPVSPPTSRAAKSPSTAKAAAAKSPRSPAGLRTANNSAKKGIKVPPAAMQKPKSRIARVAAEDGEEPAQSELAQSERAQSAAAASATSTSTGDVPMVSLRWTKNDQVNVGQECSCGLLVKNTGTLAAKDIVVEAYFPRTVRLIDADPFPNDSKDHLVWIFDHLAPGEEKTIEITMIPGRRGELPTSATVRFTGVASAVLTVEEPQLSVAIGGVSEVMVGDSLTEIITVSNPGTGIAHDVVVHARLSEELDHPRGKSVEMGIGSLGPGETRELRLPLSATAGGDALIQVEARGASNLMHRAECSIRVAAPKLSVEVAGPGLRYVGRHAQYILTVTNDGVATTDNVRLVELVPEGFEFVKADKGGKFDASSGSVTWYVGRLEAGQSARVIADLTAKQIGEYLHHVQASGENGTMAASKVMTRVEGAAAIVMEVADLDDPVEVGTQTAYEIRIRNDGSKAAQHLKVACELPPGVELIDTAGPTELASEKGTLQFKSINELPAGTTVKYLIRVNGRVAGNLRMRAKLTSSAGSEPLVVEEMTKFYAD